MNRQYDRAPGELRPTLITPHFLMHAEGSVLIEVGRTRVICAASIEERVPPFLRGTGKGWVTAEYGMLPRSTHGRMKREAAQGKQGGRTLEIQRLIGRALRASIDLKALGPRTLTLDCDVIQADGGTRTASITGAWVAMVLALRKLKKKSTINQLPPLTHVAAISVGVVKGEVVVDLDYDEDSTAEVDLNVVALEGSRLVEVQGTAENGHFDRAQLDKMLDAGTATIEKLVALQKQVLG